MITLIRQELAVHADWDAQNGLFRISARDGSLRPVDPQLLKTALFGWHAKSFYGAILETQTETAQPCIALGPYLAIDYFADPKPLRHALIRWSSEILLLMDAARLYQEALRAGWFMPDRVKWLNRSLGWKLLLPPEYQPVYADLLEHAAHLGINYLDDWFDQAVFALINSDSSVNNAFRQLAEAIKHFMPPQVVAASRKNDSLTDSGFADEETWLTAIGWIADETPFTVVLQLTEPENGESWRLRFMLRSKQDSGALTPLHADHPLSKEDLPQDWQTFFPAALERFVGNCLRLVPELKGDEGELPIQTSLDDQKAWNFLTEWSLRLADSGLTVLLPAWWDTAKRTKPRLTAKLKEAGSARQPLFGLEHIVQFDWKLAVGDLNLTEEEFRSLVSRKKHFHFLHGKWVYLDPAQAELIRRKMNAMMKTGLTVRDILGMHLSGGAETELPAETGGDSSGESEGIAVMQSIRIEVELNKHLHVLLEQLQQTDKIPLLPPPASLQGKLRSYQLRGSSWMLFLHQLGLGGCLADDMGLGKTVQWIAYLLHLREAGSLTVPALLICPTSVIGNWQKELERFAPTLSVCIHYGPQRPKGPRFAKLTGDADLVITSYNLAYLDAEELQSVQWSTLCLDEAQNIKNAYTKQASAIRKLRAEHRMALTGTPMENRLTELWSVFDFINPHYLGSLRQFAGKIVRPIEKTGDPALIARVQRLVQPFLLRRVKKDPAIRLDLPDKNEAKVFVSLTGEQAALYERVLQDMLGRIDRLPPLERKGLILATLTKLKLVCDHPGLPLKEPALRSGESFFNRSSKLVRLREMVAELVAEGDRCLIFTQFVGMGEYVAAMLQSGLREPVHFLHGGVPKAQRDKMITEFQEADLPPSGKKQAKAFVLSLKAGGVGLNLTAANHVFHIDRWWNPAVENQATDRAYRIGQTRDVQVHKFVTLGTLEERIDEMLGKKLEITEQIVGSGERWITELSTAELRDIFALRREWVEA